MRRRNRRDDGADHPDGQRELRDGLALVLDDHAPDVAFVEQLRICAST